MRGARGSGTRGVAARGPREDVWSAILEALPARWHVGPVTYNPGRYAWSVTAHGPLPGRGKVPEFVSGSGADEVAALRDLDDRLRGVPKPDGGRLEELNRRLRQAYLQGAEEDSQKRLGRGLTGEELERALRHYLGDVPESRKP